LRARFRQFLEDLQDSFWLLPSLLVLAGMGLAEAMIHAERLGITPPQLISNWIYSGGETGARTLLGAVASSTIGVAGTVFSITIATLTLASNQMGPRLLSNFTRDRGNQATLGIYLGTFAYALIVLRSVRGAEQGAFVPHMAITGAVLLALLCVGMLVFFVDHVANRINFDTVITLVARDLRQALSELPKGPFQPPPDPAFWEGGTVIAHADDGYIQQLDEEKIANWARENDTALRLHARVGNFVFPGAPLATVKPSVAGAKEVLRSALVTGSHPTASQDIEYSVGQLVDIAVRALSPGINDPRTAVRVLDRLGAALCDMAGKPLPTGVITDTNGRLLFQRNTTDYDGLTDAMFHTIRQSASGSPSVLIHIAYILRKAALCETDAARWDTLRRHGEMVRSDGVTSIANAQDKEKFLSAIERMFAALDGEPFTSG
jgi:uncharacterized membrane protein